MNFTVERISCGCPNLFNGIRSISCCNFCSESAFFVEGVSKKPGAIQFARMPKGDNSFDSVLVKASIPALALEYADWPTFPCAQIELILIIFPLIRFLIQ